MIQQFHLCFGPNMNKLSLPNASTRVKIHQLYERAHIFLLFRLVSVCVPYFGKKNADVMCVHNTLLLTQTMTSERFWYDAVYSACFLRTGVRFSSPSASCTLSSKSIVWKARTAVCHCILLTWIWPLCPSIYIYIYRSWVYIYTSKRMTNVCLLVYDMDVCFFFRKSMLYLNDGSINRRSTGMDCN